MGEGVHVCFTEEPQRFLQERTGDSGIYSSASEYIRDLVRLRLEHPNHVEKHMGRASALRGRVSRFCEPIASMENLIQIGPQMGLDEVDVGGVLHVEGNGIDKFARDSVGVAELFELHAKNGAVGGVLFDFAEIGRRIAKESYRWITATDLLVGRDSLIQGRMHWRSSYRD